MKPLGTAIRQALLCLLLVTGFTLLLLLCSAGLILYSHAMDNSPDATLLRAICAILILVFYPLSVVFGLTTVYIIKHFTNKDLRYVWLPTIIPCVLVFLYGYFVCTQNEFFSFIPSFLKPISDLLSSIPECTGVYCALYGGAVIVALFFCDERVTYAAAIPKLFLQIAVLILPMAICINYANHAREVSLLSILAYPAVFVGYFFCVVLGFYLPFTFAHNVGGHMKKFFWLMYLLSIAFMIIGLVQIAGTLFWRNSFSILVITWLSFLPQQIIDMMIELNGLLMGIAILLIGGSWLLATLAVGAEPCPRCGLYAYEEIISLGEISSKIIQKRTHHQTKLVDVTYYPYHYRMEHYQDKTDQYETVAYTNLESVHCRYCTQDFGTRTFSGTYERHINSKTDDRYEWH